jgi:ankyrin repeat protein
MRLSKPQHSDKYNRTALMYACGYNLPNVALEIINIGLSKPDQIDNDNETALMYACMNKLPEVALKLIRTELSKPDHIDSDGYTALIYACMFRLSEVAIELIRTGLSKPDQIGDYNKTALSYAYQNKLTDVISALTKNGLSVVHMAVRGLKLENLRYIFSIQPNLILVEDSKGGLAISHLIAGIHDDDIYNSANDFNHNQHLYTDFESPFSNRSEFLWFLLEISSSNKIAIDQISEEFEILYSSLSSSTNLCLDYPRRRLLMANLPTLYEPEILRDLNYSARRGALFIFFLAPLTSENMTIFTRIKTGPGSYELIKSIISFL